MYGKMPGATGSPDADDSVGCAGGRGRCVKGGGEDTRVGGGGAGVGPIGAPRGAPMGPTRTCGEPGCGCSGGA